MNLFKSFFSKKVVSIDIGTDAIKMVEISVWGNRKKLENYSEVKSSIISKDPLLLTNEEGNLVASSLISQAILEMVKEAKIKTRKVIFSLPDFLTFAASFELPPMPEKEIAGAVYFNAARYLTLPVSDVTLDWRIVKNSRDKNSSLKIFLIAIPNQVVVEYQKIATAAGLQLHALEPEVFGLMRLFAKGKQNTLCFVDMGAKTSTINIIDRGQMQRSYSFNFSGNQLTASIALALHILPEEAEKVKKREGISLSASPAAKAIQPSVDLLVAEVKDVARDFSQEEQQQITEFYLTGGSANLPGLRERFSEAFNVAVAVPNGFLQFSYPKGLEANLQEMSARFSVVLGVALSMLEI